jgi:DNA-binding NtrC family response regulator
MFSPCASPLRDRRDDIPLLINHFLDRLEQTTDQKKTLSDEAMELLMKHDWPGNVRELENSLERSWALCSGAVLQVSDLPSDLRSAKTQSSLHIGAESRIVPMAELERQAILATIEQVKGDKLMAARLLKIGKTTLLSETKGVRFKRLNPAKESGRAGPGTPAQPQFTKPFLFNNNAIGNVVATSSA